VQHRQEADGSAQQSRIGCSFEQRLGSGPEQHGVNLFRVLQSQLADLLRQSKHHVEIGDRQKLRLPLREPAGACCGLALRAMPVAARVIEDDAMSAPIALLEVTAQSSGPAIANVPQRFALMARQHPIPTIQEILLMRAEDIGQFQPMILHRTSSRSRESSGLVVVRTATSATCR